MYYSAYYSQLILTLLLLVYNDFNDMMNTMNNEFPRIVKGLQVNELTLSI